jgi:hypothetical protein
VTDELLTILTIRAAAGMIGWDKEKLRSLIRRGQGPLARRISANRIVILESDLHDWIDSLECINRPRLRGEIDQEITIDTGETDEQNAK